MLMCVHVCMGVHACMCSVCLRACAGVCVCVCVEECVCVGGVVCECKYVCEKERERAIIHAYMLHEKCVSVHWSMCIYIFPASYSTPTIKCDSVCACKCMHGCVYQYFIPF